MRKLNANNILLLMLLSLSLPEDANICHKIVVWLKEETQEKPKNKLNEFENKAHSIQTIFYFVSANASEQLLVWYK